MNDSPKNKKIEIKQRLTSGSKVNQVKSEPKHQIKSLSKSSKKQVITSFTNKKDGFVQNFSTKRIQYRPPQQKNSIIDAEYYLTSLNSNKKVKTDENIASHIKSKEVQIKKINEKLIETQQRIGSLMKQNQLQRKKIQCLQQRLKQLNTKELNVKQQIILKDDFEYKSNSNKYNQARLLKLLESTSQYQLFAKTALIDQGIQFLHAPFKMKRENAERVDGKKTLHFCSCNKEHIPQTYFWVPEKTYDFGRQFIKQKKGDITPMQYELLLYELNRLWRERQKRIVNTIRAEYSRDIQKMKRMRETKGQAQVGQAEHE